MSHAILYKTSYNAVFMQPKESMLGCLIFTDEMMVIIRPLPSFHIIIDTIKCYAQDLIHEFAVCMPSITIYTSCFVYFCFVLLSKLHNSILVHVKTDLDSNTIQPVHVVYPLFYNNLNADTSASNTLVIKYHNITGHQECLLLSYRQLCSVNHFLF